jgi:hypothetical protein
LPLLASLLCLDPVEASFERRGFRTSSERSARERLEEAGRTFVHGYNVALRTRDPGQLAQRLSELPWQTRGFGFEGAAMACCLLDRMIPFGGDRWRRLVTGPGAPHVYMVHIGAGWALARLRRRLPSSMPGLDPVLCWLVADGYGFHEGYFRPGRTISEQRVPRRVRGYARCAFDQGLGRSLWFVHGAAPDEIHAAVERFGPGRRPHLWSGIGLAATYAGAGSEPVLRRLLELGEPYRAELAQGAAWAARARSRAGNPTSHTEMACGLLAGLPVERAAGVVDEAFARSRGTAATPRYESWRRETAELLVHKGGVRR